MFPLSRVLQRACALYADHTAVVDGDERLSYATLAARASQLASALLGLGLERGDRVAILDHNSARFLELHFACAQAGLVFVPLNDRLTGSDIAYMLGDAGARARGWCS
jgi:fatty-acyl-CoA synthase